MRKKDRIVNKIYGTYVDGLRQRGILPRKGSRPIPGSLEDAMGNTATLYPRKRRGR